MRRCEDSTRTTERTGLAVHKIIVKLDQIARAGFCCFSRLIQQRLTNKKRNGVRIDAQRRLAVRTNVNFDHEAAAVSELFSLLVWITRQVSAQSVAEGHG